MKVVVEEVVTNQMPVIQLLQCGSCLQLLPAYLL